MNRLFLLSVGLCILFSSEPRDVQGEQPAEASTLQSGSESDLEWGFGGVGGVYFLASPGELTIEVAKRDRNRRVREAELRAILFGPDRRVLAEAIIPDDGQPRGSGTGPLQRTSLSTNVGRKGVYGLNVTVSQDRYGDDTIWGFDTNCPHYLIETARGHRDERRQEPIVLLAPERSGDVCFVPRRGAFDVEITNLPTGVNAIPVFDANDNRIDTLAVSAAGKVTHAFSADHSRDAMPWRMHLSKQQAVVQIDSVTRWEPGDAYLNLPYWTPTSTAYFPLQDYRWLLTPYSRTVYGQAGTNGQAVFQLHNNSQHAISVQLQLEFPNAPWPVRLSADRVELRSKQQVEVHAEFTFPAERNTRTVHLRVTPDDPHESGFSTYSTLTVKAGRAPAAESLNMPLVLKPYQHENEQFGYLPDYPLENQVYFDQDNRPFFSTSNGVSTLRDRGWTAVGLRKADQPRDSAALSRSLSPLSTKLSFDRANHLYLLAREGTKAFLVRSADHGRTLDAYPIPGRPAQRGSFDMEQFSGHNVLDGPPPIVRFTQISADPKMRWRRINNLELILARNEAGQLSFDKPIAISDRCIGLSVHSGIVSSVVSRGTKVHVAWAEATEPNDNVPGVPTYVVTFDRETGELGEPILVGYGAPPNDIHNSPSITMDCGGFLHVLVGTHGRPFQYVRSLQPNSAHGGWTKPVAVGDDLRQTYIGLVCGPDDTLHLAYRLWRYETDPFPASHHAVLAYQRKPPGEPWGKPRPLIVPPFSEYSIFYHRLTLDRTGRLFLSYDYWSTFWFYRTDHRGNRRALLLSPDGGDTWRLAQTSDLQ